MQKSKQVSTPLGQCFKLAASQAPNNKEEVKYMTRVPFANAVGNIMYTMVCSRPDVAHDISLVSIFMSNPSIAL